MRQCGDAKGCDVFYLCIKLCCGMRRLRDKMQRRESARVDWTTLMHKRGPHCDSYSVAGSQPSPVWPNQSNARLRGEAQGGKNPSMKDAWKQSSLSLHLSKKQKRKRKRKRRSGKDHDTYKYNHMNRSSWQPRYLCQVSAINQLPLLEPHPSGCQAVSRENPAPALRGLRSAVQFELTRW